MNQGFHPTCLTGHRDRTVVDDVVGPLGGILVETVDVQPGQRVLDVAAGTGSSALPATRRGASVTATPITYAACGIGSPTGWLLSSPSRSTVQRWSEFRDMKANYGPTIAVYRFIADDPAKVAGLDADLAALGDRFLTTAP